MHDVIDARELDADQDRARNRRFGFHDAARRLRRTPVIATGYLKAAEFANPGRPPPSCLAHVWQRSAIGGTAGPSVQPQRG
jgi:hypothetical protein